VASLKTRRLIAVGAFAATAAAAPLFISTMTSSSSPDVSAQPACLAWFGNKDDGHCLSYSNGQPIFAGTPQYNAGNGPDAGLSTGPLFPGTTINRGIG
jgi:hypothetical protein